MDYPLTLPEDRTEEGLSEFFYYPKEDGWAYDVK